MRSKTNSPWKYIGCSHQRVPSLSNTAMRWSGGTKSGVPSRVTFATNDRIAARDGPMFQEGSGGSSPRATDELKMLDAASRASSQRRIADQSRKAQALRAA